MKPSPALRLLWCLSPLFLGACSEADLSSSTGAAPRTSQAERAPKTAGVLSSFDVSPRAPRAEAAPAERGFGLAHLPAETLFAVRVTDLRGHDQAWDGLALSRALARLDADALFGGPLAELCDTVREKIPGGDELLKTWEKVGGEAVLALLDVDANAMNTYDGQMPFSLAAFIELGDGEASFRAFLDAVDADPESDSRFHTNGDDGFTIRGDGGHLDLRFVDGRLCAWIGPESKGDGALDRLLELSADRSFVATPLARATPPEHDGETRWLEAFVHLSPIWNQLLGFVPPEAEPFLAAANIEGLTGLSLVSSIDGDRFHDIGTLHTDGEDIVSLMLDQPTVDPSWSRFVFTDADAGGISSFDASETFDRIRKRLPSMMQQGLSEGLGAFARATGFDLQRDVLKNLGPHIVWSGRGNLASAMLDAEDFELAVAIEVGDRAKVSELLNEAFRTGGLPVYPRPRKTGDVSFFSFALPLPDGPPGLEPSYGFVGNALVLASSGETFIKVVDAVGKDGGSAPSWLRAALEQTGEGTLSISGGEAGAQLRGLAAMLRTVQAETDESWPLPSDDVVETIAEELPAEAIHARRTADGFVVDNRSPFGAAIIGVAPLAIVASIAIPNLMAARLSANESAAVSHLKNLVSAQAQFQASAVADRDGNGRGEFGTFGEMAGHAELPDGHLLEPPILGRMYAAVEDGVVVRSGYVFRIALPGATGEPVAERTEGGPPLDVDVRMAEQYWIAYAYPVDPGATGGQVFFVDQTGHMLSSTNDSPDQLYSIDVPPPLDAAFAANDRPLSNGGHIGQDGGYWTLVQ